MWYAWSLAAFTWLLWSGDHVTRGDYLKFVGNESALRKALLTSSGYDVKIRPNTTVSISIGLSVLSLNSLNIKDQVMSTSAWLSMEWSDERLTWAPANYDNIQYIFDTEKVIWRPEVIIDNSVTNVGVINDENLLIRVRHDGHLLWEPLKLFETSCSIDVTSYPFDEQRCAIDVVSWTFSIDEVTLTHLNSAINMADYQDNGEWTFEKSKVIKSSVVDGALNYSKLSFCLTFRRRPAFLVLSVLLPVALTSLLSVLVFVLPLDSGEKVSYSLTVLLSYAVLLTLVSDTMPSTSINLSIISLYMAATLFLGCLVVVLTVANLYMHHHHPQPPPPSWLLSYARSVMLKVTGSNKVTQAHASVTHKVREDEETSKNVVSPIESFVKTGTDDVTTEGEESGNDADAMVKWRDIARLHDAFCYRIVSISIILVTVIFFLALVISGYTDF